MAGSARASRLRRPAGITCAHPCFTAHPRFAASCQACPHCSFLRPHCSPSSRASTRRWVPASTHFTPCSLFIFIFSLAKTHFSRGYVGRALDRVFDAPLSLRQPLSVPSGRAPCRQTRTPLSASCWVRRGSRERGRLETGGRRGGGASTLPVRPFDAMFPPFAGLLALACVVYLSVYRRLKHSG